MTFELEISTMRKTKEECFEMLEKMNVHCDCLIINQCDKDDYFEQTEGGRTVRIFFTTERGLSKSRNMALKNCKADILGIADDDLYYYEDFDKKICEAYLQNPKAGAMIFNMDSYDKTYPNVGFKCNFFRLFGFCSMLCTFRMHNIRNAHKIDGSDLKFNEYFGTGGQYFQSGEENIFLADCYHAGIPIYYTPIKILRRDESPSSWFHGYDEEFLEARGAIFYAMSKFWYLFLIFQFAVRKKKLFKGFSFFRMLSVMNNGKKKYLKIISSKENRIK